MKMEISKRCIGLEEEMSKRIEGLVRTSRKKKGSSTSVASSRTSVLGNMSATGGSCNKIPGAD